MLLSGVGARATAASYEASDRARDRPPRAGAADDDVVGSARERLRIDIVRFWSCAASRGPRIPGVTIRNGDGCVAPQSGELARRGDDAVRAGIAAEPRQPEHLVLERWPDSRARGISSPSRLVSIVTPRTRGADRPDPARARAAAASASRARPQRAR